MEEIDLEAANILESLALIGSTKWIFCGHRSKGAIIWWWIDTIAILIYLIDTFNTQNMYICTIFQILITSLPKNEQNMQHLLLFLEIPIERKPS